MSNIKYQPAPTQDPDQYTQAPPGYQAGSSSSTNETTGLFGGPERSSEDNIPDDFKFGGTIYEATTDIRNQFIRKVYTILSVQLVLTAAVSALTFLSNDYKTWIQSHAWAVWGSLIGALVFMGLSFWKRKSYPSNLIFLGVFTLFEAYTVSVIVSFYDVALVLNALIITAGIFVFLSVFAIQTTYDFSSWGPYLFGSLWGLVMVGFIYIFLPQSRGFDLFWGIACALIFSAYILYDTQMIMKHYHVEEEIAAAISLYLDIINLFLAILRILNGSSND